ncbi:hypothetical protein [Pantoea sp. App145]|uniref:hypothetical protein n=1 Tax=Pantoea sp. App145 TaxID=3071567 RepID=UPI003A7FA4B8
MNEVTWIDSHKRAKGCSMYNNRIITKVQSDKALAQRLDSALTSVAQNMETQLKQMDQGLTRLTWYASCVTKNYQDVCSKLKDEDVRFWFGVYELIKRRDIVFDMIKIYVDRRLFGVIEQDLKKIAEVLSKGGSRFSSNQATRFSLAMAISRAISISFNISNPIIGKTSMTAAFVLSNYGMVQEAADAAARLRNTASFYYELLRQQRLEMMYFLIEPAFKRIRHPWPGDVDGAIYELRSLMGD